MSSLKALPLFFILTLTLSVPSMVNALPAEIAHNLRQLEGVIVMPIGDEYLIDLDASKGIAEGDIFSVITPGPAVIHPVTGEEIGSLDRVEGWLEVTRIKSGYSYVRPLDAESHFDKKTKLHRFTNLPAVFWDYTGAGEKVFNELRSTLPHLEWHTYLSDQALRPSEPGSIASDKPALTFVYQAGQLQIRGLNFRLLGQYPLTSAATHMPVAASPLSVPTSPTSNIVTISSAPKETPQAIVHSQAQDTADIWSSAGLAGNPVGIEVADFDADGVNEIAILHKNMLEIGQFNGREYRIIQKLPLRGIDKALTLSSADQDGDGRPELFISAIDGLEVDSLIVAVKDGRYQIIQANLPWFLRAVQNPDGGKTVLGQRLGDKSDIFDYKIVKMEFLNGRATSTGEYSHPWRTNLFSLQPVLEAEGKTGYAEISVNDRLRFFSAENEELWESSERYGGSLVSFPQDGSTGGSGYSETLIYLTPRLALLDSKTILAPLNEGGRISKSFQSIGPGQVSALRWDGNSLIELWHTKPQQGSLADFQYADIDNDQKPELVLLMHFKRSGLFNKGNSGLRIFEID